MKPVLAFILILATFVPLKLKMEAACDRIVPGALSIDYLELGEDFLVRGIAYNPEKPQLYEALARLYRDKFHDHVRAAENFEKASRLPDHASYDERFSAYELSYSEGREREAYDRLRALYQRGEKQRLPRLLNQLRVMEERLNIPANERIIP